jgi:galactose-1-phosphate uridylyltransferase
VSELRQDPTTEERVTIASERAKRPSDFVHRQSERNLPEFSPSCPFCPDNESMTIPATLLYQQRNSTGIDVLCSDKTGTLTKSELTPGEPFTIVGFELEDVILFGLAPRHRRLRLDRMNEKERIWIFQI